MLMLLSPAKSLDLESKVSARGATQPRLLSESERLVALMRERSVADIARLHGISDELAALNAQRWADFQTPFTARNARPAVSTFAGDVYQGLDAATLTGRDLAEAAKTVRLLSGLYGVLRPRDLIQPYRLEMGTRLPNPRGDDLYAFWGSRVTDLLREDLDASPGARVVVNLASNEYAAAVDLGALDAQVIAPRFEDQAQSGEWKVISFAAKRARGLMARHLVQARARNAAAVRRFDGGGYRLATDISTAETPVFRRQRQA